MTSSDDDLDFFGVPPREVAAAPSPIIPDIEPGPRKGLLISNRVIASTAVVPPDKVLVSVDFFSCTS